MKKLVILVRLIKSDRRLAASPLILWCLVIFLLSSIPGNRYPEEPFFMADKAMHVQLYFWGGLFAALYFCRKRPAYLAALAFGVLYGASDELHQLFVPQRSFSVTDWLADIVGVCTGLVVHRFYMQRFHEPPVGSSTYFNSHRTEVI